jgi:uncharacterized membrane protein
LKEKLTQFLIDHLSFLPPELIVVIISAMPILELRGGLPIAYAYYEFSLLKALLLSILGNLLPIIPLLFLFQPISNWLMRFKVYEKLYSWLYKRTIKKSGNVEKYGAIGLILFTAIPLPTTGAYSACVAAGIFAIRFKYAFLAISAGVVIAGLGIGVLSYTIW